MPSDNPTDVPVSGEDSSPLPSDSDDLVKIEQGTLAAVGPVVAPRRSSAAEKEARALATRKRLMARFRNNSRPWYKDSKRRDPAVDGDEVDAFKGKRSRREPKVQTQFRPEHATLLTHFSVYKIAPPYTDSYVCWVLRSAADHDELWGALQVNKAIRKFWALHKEELTARAQPIYAEATNGVPLGKSFSALARDMQRCRALFAQLYGFRNAVMCELCEKHYRNNMGLVNDVGETPHVMAPWFECLSLPGFSGSCGNCLFRNGDTGCSFYLPRRGADEAPDWVASKRGSETTEAELGPRKFSLTTSPCVGEDLAGPALEKQGKVEARFCMV